MIMTPRQQVTTAFLAVLIVASVMSMPRSMDVPREPRLAVKASGAVAPRPSVHAELATEQVRDLTYN